MCGGINIKNLLRLGCVIFPSNGNFVLVKSIITDLVRMLIAYGIMITDLSDDWLEVYYRITVGLTEENDGILLAMKSIYAKEEHLYKVISN